MGGFRLDGREQELFNPTQVKLLSFRFRTLFENQGIEIEQHSDVISPWMNPDSLGTTQEFHKTQVRYIHDQYHQFVVKNIKNMYF